MSRAELSVVMYGQDAVAVRLARLGERRVACEQLVGPGIRCRARSRGCRTGTRPCRPRRSSVTAVDSPTPRGSKPITSNCCAQRLAHRERHRVADRARRRSRPGRRDWSAATRSARRRVGAAADHATARSRPSPGRPSRAARVTVVQSKLVVARRPVERLLVERQQLGRRRPRCRAPGSPSDAGAGSGIMRVEAAAQGDGCRGQARDDGDDAMPSAGRRRRGRVFTGSFRSRRSRACSRGRGWGRRSARDSRGSRAMRSTTVSVRSALHAAASARSSDSSSRLMSSVVAAELQHQHVAEHRLQVGEHAVDAVAQAARRAALLIVLERRELRAHRRRDGRALGDAERAQQRRRARPRRAPR